MKLPGRRAIDHELVRVSRQVRQGVHGLGPGLITGVAGDAGGFEDLLDALLLGDGGGGYG